MVLSLLINIRLYFKYEFQINWRVRPCTSPLFFLLVFLLSLLTFVLTKTCVCVRCIMLGGNSCWSVR